MAQASILAKSAGLLPVAKLGLSQIPSRSTKISPADLAFVSANRNALVSVNTRSSSARLAKREGVVALFQKTKPATSKVTADKGAKYRAETGIFGTSGGIGFTKQNELFVGRLAMLGFAAAILGEAITGKGPLAQFDIESGLPLTETEPLLIFFILFQLLGAIGALGSRGQFVDDDIESGLPVLPGKSVKGALGLAEKGPTFGFTKANELFVGRIAQLGFAIAIIGELITGKGALAQLNIETGVPVTELEPLVLAWIAFFFVAAINPGTGKFINDDEAK